MTNFTANGITPEVSVRGLLMRIDELTLQQFLIGEDTVKEEK
jgi:hypothetical protein